MTHQLRIIKNQDDCSEFLNWLREHPQIENVQGFRLRRDETQRVRGFVYGEHCDEQHWADVNWMYRERKMLNDWIRTQLA